MNNYAWLRTMLHRDVLSADDMLRLCYTLGQTPGGDVKETLLNEVDTHDLNDELPAFATLVLAEMGHKPAPTPVEDPGLTMVTFPHTWGELLTWENDPARTHYELYAVANAIPGVKAAGTEEQLKRQLAAHAQSLDASDSLPATVQEAVERAKLGRESFKDRVVRLNKKVW